MDVKDTLKSIELFNGLTEEQFEMMLPNAEVVSVPKDQNLFAVGQEASDIYVLLEGKLSIQVKLSSRPETVGIVVLQNRGQLVGWSGLMGSSHYTAAGMCLEASKLLRVNGKALMEVLESNPCTGFLVMREISKVISNRIRNLQSVVLKTI
jgi:toluene monooxygenase system ferredoxin subunit